MKSFRSFSQIVKENILKDTSYHLMKYAELVEDCEATKHSILRYDKIADVSYIKRRNENLLMKYGIFAPNFESKELILSTKNSSTLKTSCFAKK